MEDLPSTHQTVAGREQGPARFLTAPSRSFSFATNLSTQSIRAGRGPIASVRAPSVFHPRDTKAGDGKQPARERQLLHERAEATTQVVLISPLGSRCCSDAACPGEARPSTSSPRDHRQAPPPLSSGFPAWIKEEINGSPPCLTQRAVGQLDDRCNHEGKESWRLLSSHGVHGPGAWKWRGRVPPRVPQHMNGTIRTESRVPDCKPGRYRPGTLDFRCLSGSSAACCWKFRSLHSIWDLAPARKGTVIPPHLLGVGTPEQKEPL